MDGLGKGGGGVRSGNRTNATVAVAAREARRRTEEEAAARRAARGARGRSTADVDSTATRPTLGLSASSLQQEWSKRLGLPSVNTTARRRASAEVTGSSPTTAAARRAKPSRQSAPVLSTSTATGASARRVVRDRAGDGAARGSSSGRPTNPADSARRPSATATSGALVQPTKASQARTADRRRGSEWADEVLATHERPVIVPPAPTMAQRLNLIPAPPEPLSNHAWAQCKQRAIERGDGTTQPCAICMMPFGTNRQVLLNCSHVFHYFCLRSYERHTQKASCPVCRLEHYQGLEITEGAQHHRNESATKIQALWRGHAARSALEAKGQLPRCTALPRTQRRLAATTHRLASSVQSRANAVDDFLAELEASSARCKAVISDAHRRVVFKPLAEDEWAKVEATAREAGRFGGECAICYQAFENAPGNPATLLSCGHVLHKVCLEALERYAFSELPTCPCCRSTYRKRPAVTGPS